MFRRSSLLVPFSLYVLGMETSTYSCSYQNAQISIQRKFYGWVLKWIHGGCATYLDSNTEETYDIEQATKPDVRILASFLQAIGFKLLSFEKHNDATAEAKNNNVSTSKHGIVRVAIECDTSNMKAVLELNGITCRCPNPENIKDASFWSISGTGGSGGTDSFVQKVEETGSNLLPPLSKDVSRLLRDVSIKLFDTIIGESDTNHDASAQTLKKEVGIVRSNTQPDIPLRANSSNSMRPPSSEINTKFEEPIVPSVSLMRPNKYDLQRQRSWEIDVEVQSFNEEPRPSPSKLTSSPAMIAELSNSLGQISVQSDVESYRLIADYVTEAQRILGKALKVLLDSNSSVRCDLSPGLADQDTDSIKSAPAGISPSVIVSSSYTRSTQSRKSDDPDAVLRMQKLYKYNITNMPETRPHLPKGRHSIEPILSKSPQQRNEHESTPRRSSLHLPSSASPNLLLPSKPEMNQKLLGIGKYSTSRTGIPVESNSSSRASSRSVDSRFNSSTNLESSSSSNGRASLLKQPSRISKSIPVKVKPMPTAKVNTGAVRKPRSSLPKD